MERGSGPRGESFTLLAGSLAPALIQSRRIWTSFLEMAWPLGGMAPGISSEKVTTWKKRLASGLPGTIQLVPMSFAMACVSLIGGMVERRLSPWQWTQFVSSTLRTGAKAVVSASLTGF